MSEMLLIFVRNPELGKVKSRLAKTIGKQAALEVYKLLLEHTFKVSNTIQQSKRVCYADEIGEKDIWDQANFEKSLQRSGDLGFKMRSAFEQAFADQYKKVILIGSDCVELSADILTDAFAALDNHDLVLGPALDGGYYLIGMNNLYPELFENKPWSTELVADLTLQDAEKRKLNVKLLPALSDIDEEDDLKRSPFAFSIFEKQNQ